MLIFTGSISVNAESFNKIGMSKNEFETRNLNKTFLSTTNKEIDIEKIKNITLKNNYSIDDLNLIETKTSDLFLSEVQNNESLTTSFLGSTSEANTETENTTPGNSSYFAFNGVVNGNISAESEIRWYITQLNEKSKATVFLQLSDSESQNFDLYLFRFNQEQEKLDFVTGSANELGKNEIIDSVLEKGIYLIAIESKKGTGDFTVFPFSSTLDVEYEINDSVENATPLTQKNNMSIQAVIDNPFDFDIYKFEVTEKEISKVELISPAGKNYMLLYYDGNTVNAAQDLMEFNIGTHYLIVKSSSGDYSQTAPYTLKKSIRVLGDENEIAASRNRRYILSYKKSTGNYYINNRVINFAYNYKHDFSDSKSGTHSKTRMSIAETNQTYVRIGSNIAFGSYRTSFPSTRSISNCIKLTVSGINGRMYRSSSGLHSGPQADYNFTTATIIIDPSTGKVYDLKSPNYFYGNTNHKSTFTPE